MGQAPIDKECWGAATPAERNPAVRIIRSHRKTVGLEITEAGNLLVRAPRRISVAEIEEIIRRKRAWIQRKAEEEKNRPRHPVREYSEGEIFFFLGREYPLRFVEGESGGGIHRSDCIYIHGGTRPDVADRLNRWYREEARKEIPARCMWFSLTTGYVPASVRITDARRRWGSCSAHGVLNFSWRLVQAPMEIVDYVVVHELVHLRHHNHSKAFWAAVRTIMPDYARRRSWLKMHEHLLAL